MTVSYTQRKRDAPVPYPPFMPREHNVAKGRQWILVMDDHANTRSVLCRMLEAKGYRTYGTSNGDEAVSSYRKAKDCGYAFDAVILDLHVLEGKNGKDAMSELLALDPHVRAIIATGDMLDPVVEDFSAFGFKGILPKPFNINQLDETVRIALAV